MKVALMVTCLGDVLRPEVGQATVRLLLRLGHEVQFPADQTCCGQPMFNSGFADLARRQARHTIRVFAGDDPVVVPSGSCAAMLKVEYPHLLEDDRAWHGRAIDLAARTFELSDFIVNRLRLVDVGGKFTGKVTYHFACHLRMLGQCATMLPPNMPSAVVKDSAGKTASSDSSSTASSSTAAAETLIRHVSGATYVPLHRQDQCCGFGGSFAVRYGNISTAMVDDKVACIMATGADAVVSTDSGCLMNIGGRLRRLEKPIEVLHLAELLAGRKS